jgi:lipoprotein-anchoring transpeptidase ErfK/SrfK
VPAVRPTFLIALVGALALAAVSFAFTSASRARARRVAAQAASAPAPQRPSPLRPVTRLPAPAKSAAAVPEKHHAGPAPAQVLRVRDGRTVALRDRPHGHVIARLADHTEFGSPTALSVARRHGRWAGVPSSALGNGRLGWVDTKSGAVDRRTTDVRLVVSVAHRRLELRVRGHVKRHVRVAVGRPGSTTPRGHFSITDKLAGSRYGPYYGCCILALSGHQPHPPPGWTGGSRLAIHGTNAPSTIGTPSSAGCLRAADEDLRVLMRRVPLGTPVLIRA